MEEKKAIPASELEDVSGGLGGSIRLIGAELQDVTAPEITKIGTDAFGPSGLADDSVIPSAVTNIGS